MDKTSWTYSKQDFVQLAAEKGEAGSNLFPVLRLLLPKLDKERGAYNLKVRQV